MPNKPLDDEIDAIIAILLSVKGKDYFWVNRNGSALFREAESKLWRMIEDLE